MDKFDELLEKEKGLYSSLYLDVNDAIDKIEPFIDKSQLNKRFFFKNRKNPWIYIFTKNI